MTTAKEVEEVTMTTAGNGTTAGSGTSAANADIKVLPLSTSCAEVRLSTGGMGTSIGKVSARGDRWYWQHRDGEQSSPIAANRTEAARALAAYHRAFKAPPAPAAPVRRLLFG